MNRAVFVTLVALAGCTGAAMGELVLPMNVPPVVAGATGKGAPLHVGASVAVPVEVQRIDVGALDWVDGTARLRVSWPGARGLQLRLEADGIWAPDASVRVLDADGAALHADRWVPAERSLWVSPPAPADELILLFETPPGDGAGLAVVAATTRTRQ